MNEGEGSHRKLQQCSKATVAHRHRLAALCRELTVASHLRSERDGERIPDGRSTVEAQSGSSGCGWGEESLGWSTEHMQVGAKETDRTKRGRGGTLRKASFRES